MDVVLAQMRDATLAWCWAVPELSEREKVFLTLTADVCNATLGTPYEEHVADAAKRGVCAADIRALLRLLAFDTGYPAAEAAMARLAQIGGPGEAAPLAEELVRPGESPLPEWVRAPLRELDPWFHDYLLLQSRMNSPQGEGTLSVRERAFVAMSVDVHYQTLGDTFGIHVRRALGGGAGPADVRAALRFLSQFGLTRAWQAWRALNPLLDSLVG